MSDKESKVRLTKDIVDVLEYFMPTDTTFLLKYMFLQHRLLYVICVHQIVGEQESTLKTSLVDN